MDNEQKIFELIDATFNNHWHSTTDLVKRELAKRILELIQSKQKGKELTEEALKKEAWLFIANDDEYARIVPDGEIDRFSEFMAKFTHHLWEKDLIQSKQKGKE